jgi:hypothetical protein
MRDGGIPMHELGAELDRDRQPGQATGPYPAADALARLEHQHGTAGARERPGSG